MHQQLVLVLLLCFYSIIVNSQTKYSRVKIDLTKTDIQELNRLGLETDHGSLIPGVHFVNDFSEKEVALINQAGIENYILIEDVKADYKANKNTSTSRSVGCMDEVLYDYETPENYTFGSMGGYHTYNEMILVLEQMREKYPNLITRTNVVEGIKTWEDNDIIWLRLSDNPDVDEDEPEVLYTALHHAREPNGLSQMIFYIWYLLENYETDPRVKYLVDNTEMYFMPCLNPDGYKFNELTDPDGGGFWRKNRRPDADPERVGVDLNRNYGFFWGFDNSGSSPNMTSNTYRGPQAFSEPETQAVREFCIAHNFQIALNYHTHGNLLIHPWGYNDEPTDEDALFKAMGNAMAKENNFRLGTGTETVGYVVNGDSDDYMYGEEAEKNKIYTFTPEVGSSFWPQQSQIDQLNKSCMLQNLNTANLLLNFYDVSIEKIEPIVSANEGTIEMRAIKAGLGSGDASVTIVSNNPDILSFNEFVFELSLNQTENVVIPLEFVISENAPSLQDLSFDVLVDNGEFENRETYGFTYRNTIFEEELIDDFTNLNNWNTEVTTWGLTESVFVSAPTSLTDSPGGDYERNRTDSILLVNQINLEESDFTSLKFSARWLIEFNYDYVLVQASNDNGENWVSLCGNYTRPGVNTHGTNDPLYDGLQEEWVIEEIDLSEYQGQVINLQLVFVSDAGVEMDGFYVDDILIENNTLVSVGTEDIWDSKVFSVLPSLNNGTFDVEIDIDIVGEEAIIEVLDIQGKLLERRENVSENETVNLKNITSGVYIIKLMDSNGKSVSKKINVLR